MAPAPDDGMSPVIIPGCISPLGAEGTLTPSVASGNSLKP